MNVDEKVDIKKSLRVFQKLVDTGEQVGNEYHLNGLRAYTDFDGYTITLCNDYVTLTIYFHNKYAFDYANPKERSLFLEKIDRLDQK